MCDNERDCLDRIELKDVRDADDKQWFIECEAIRLRELEIGAESLARTKEADARIAEAKAIEAEALARKAEAERDLFVLKASQPKTDGATLEVSCGYCDAVFKYSGHSESEMTTMHEKFVDEHGYCRS